jgi:type IV secretory pathway TrbD component
MQARQIVIHPSINRPHLLLGADRDAILLSGIASAALGYSMLSVSAVGVAGAVVLWLAAILVLRKIAAADPLMWRVYLRHRGYRDWYPARAAIWSQSAPLPRRWKR